VLGAELAQQDGQQVAGGLQVFFLEIDIDPRNANGGADGETLEELVDNSRVMMVLPAPGIPGQK